MTITTAFDRRPRMLYIKLYRDTHPKDVFRTPILHPRHTLIITAESSAVRTMMHIEKVSCHTHSVLCRFAPCSSNKRTISNRPCIDARCNECSERLLFRGIYIGAVVEQQPHNVNVPHSCCPVQRSPAKVVSGVHICTIVN